MSAETAKAINNLAEAIREAFSLKEDMSPPASLADAVHEAGSDVKYALLQLGNANACTPMGALEAFGLVVQEASQRIAEGLSDIARALEEKE